MNQPNKPEMGNNEIKFKYQCPLLWQNLEKTEDEKIRFCHTCEKKVTFIESQDELYQAAYSGSCGFFMRKGDAFIAVKEADEWKPGMPIPLGGHIVMPPPLSPEFRVVGGHFMPPPPITPLSSPPQKNPILRIKDKIFGLFFRR